MRSAWWVGAPRAIGKAVQICCPMFPKTPLAARFALYSIGAVDWIASQDTHFVPIMAFVAGYAGFKDLSSTFLAPSKGKRSINLLVHVDLQQPIFDFFFLSFRYEIFHGHVDIIRGRNIGNAEFIILRNIVIVRILNNLIDVKVSVEKD